VSDQHGAACSCCQALYVANAPDNGKLDDQPDSFFADTCEGGAWAGSCNLLAYRFELTLPPMVCSAEAEGRQPVPDFQGVGCVRGCEWVCAFVCAISSARLAAPQQFVKRTKGPTGPNGAQYYVAEFKYELYTGAGFVVERHGLASITQVGRACCT
jgi:hypothetical protein